MNHKKAGVIALIAAVLVAYSRLYLFMHFPTDVLFGSILGIVLGVLAAKLCDRYYEQKINKNVTVGDMNTK